ncbi:MAG: hypothetical protein NWR72_06880 [Bacteroidia bacterium]|nr:hypothetical protein [Bacteroidia bacterium]
MKSLIAYLLIIFSLPVFGFRIYESAIFKQQVTGYLKHAADANTIELANEELTKALVYLEQHNLTSGHTSILWETPDDDIGFWYRNLKASQTELQTLQSSSALERTNVLLKLRETIMDGGEKSKVTVPKGISVHPDNPLWAALMLAATLALSFGSIMLIPKEGVMEGEGKGEGIGK